MKKLIQPYIDAGITQQEYMIKNKMDNVDIRVKVYAPVNQSAQLPAVLFIHGGGYMFGSIEGDDAKCARYVKEINCVVVSVDYRLAPENPYPAAIEDCYAALQWMVNEHKKLNIDTTKVAVVGGSTGGGLTAALTLLARDRKGPDVKFQMPLFPMLDDSCTTYSSNEFTDKRVWSRDLNRFAWSMYLKGVEGDTPKYAAPMRETDFSQLPPTYTTVGSLDPFRDETMNYVRALTDAGVPVEFHLYPGGYHEFEAMVPDSGISKKAIRESIEALKRGLAD
ncbi:esterase [Macrococcus hajekii]|uniref:alpha/beta hydrolase n=1 Tax=Macrococcus hajekii TaxID=198482 RepID=UPI0019A9745F|nr:alpha/beta hydrolase [Macrococcus hajekii]GGB09101.1 esterase [Macrococcus hajekii]